MPSLAAGKGRRRDARLIEGGPRLRTRYDFLLTLVLHAPSWLDRFAADASREAEGRARVEAVLSALTEAGLRIKCKRHRSRDGAKLLLVFITAEPARLARQAEKLRIERWLQEDGVGDMSRYGTEMILQQSNAKDHNLKVVKSGGLHYFAPVHPASDDVPEPVPKGSASIPPGACDGTVSAAHSACGTVGSGGEDGFGGGLRSGGTDGFSGGLRSGGTDGFGGCATRSDRADEPNSGTPNSLAGVTVGSGGADGFGGGLRSGGADGFGASATSCGGADGFHGVRNDDTKDFGGGLASGSDGAPSASPLSQGICDGKGPATSSAVVMAEAASLEVAQSSLISSAFRVELVSHILNSPPERGGAGMAALIKADPRKATILHMVPLHDPHFNASLYKQANRLNPWSPWQRDAFLGDIRWQFGEKVAFCYAFNVFYCTWLGAAAIPGTFLWLLGFFVDEQAKTLYPFYAIFMAFWSLLLCKAWERKEHALAIEWGVSHAKQSDAVRPGFVGWPRTSPITGEVELHYPKHLRALKYCVTGLLTAAQVAVMVVLIALLYSAFFWIQSTNFSWLETLLLNLSCSTAWGISLELLNWIVWSRLAAALNRFENHKTSNSHENHLIAKIFIFFFIDCFLWFFILAFFQIPFGSQIDGVLNSLGVVLDKPFEREDWVPRLGMTIGAVLSVTQWSMLIFADAYFPYWLMKHWERRQAAKDVQKRSTAGKSKSRTRLAGALAGNAPLGPVCASEMELGSVSSSVAVERPSTGTRTAHRGLDHATMELQRAGRVPGGAGGIADLVGGGVVRGATLTATGSAIRSGKYGFGPKGPTAGKVDSFLKQATATPYDPMLDYSGMVIQYGYVAFFSVSWPLAPLVCLLHTMLRLRSNTLRLTKLSQRPLPESVNGIGLWRTLLGFEALVAVLLNCLIVSISTDQLDHISCWIHSLMRDAGECDLGDVPTSARFLIAFAAENVLLVLAFLIMKMIPNQRKDVRMHLARQAFQFKRRYYETVEAEALLEGGTAATSRSSFGARGTAGAQRIQPNAWVDFSSEWASCSDLSDGMEEIEVPPSIAAGVRPRAAPSRTDTHSVSVVASGCNALVGSRHAPPPLPPPPNAGLVLKGGGGVGGGSRVAARGSTARDRAAAANAAKRTGAGAGAAGPGARV